MPKLSFEDWVARIDTELDALVGLSHDDLPDWDYRSAYEEEMSPKAAAMKAIKNAGEY